MKHIPEHLTPTTEIHATGRVGTCFASRAELERLFGPPHMTFSGPYDKTSHEWAFKYRGEVFTIYDYDQSTPYSVGGRSIRGLAAARAAIGPAVRREMYGAALPKHLRAHFGQPLTNALDVMEAA